MRARAWLWLGIVALIACGAGSGKHAVASENCSGTEIPLKPYAGKLRTVDVLMRGGKALPFLFDTGGGMTLIDPQIARMLGCKPDATVSVKRMDGSSVDFEPCGVQKMQVSGFEVEAPVAIFDLATVLPKELPPVYGVISLHTFSKYAITLDLAGGRVHVENRCSFNRRIAGAAPLKMKIARQAENLTLDVLVAVTVENKELWMELDTGNLDTVFLSGEPSDVERIELQFEGLQPLTVEARRKPLIYDGVLNASTLERMILFLDIPAEKLYAILAPATPPHP